MISRHTIHDSIANDFSTEQSKPGKRTMRYLNLTTRFHIESCIPCNGRGAIGHGTDWLTCETCDGVGKIEHITVEKSNESNQDKNGSAMPCLLW